jgi:adenosylhomocysteine nucleosidase
MERIGIIAGMPDELEAFLPDYRRSVAFAEPVLVEQVLLGGKTIFLACAGIGKVAASTAATLLYSRYQVELLVVIGTAGNIGNSASGVFNIEAAFQADFGAQRSAGLVHYNAGSLPIGTPQIDAFLPMPVPGLQIPSARIATSDLFIECANHAGRIRAALDVTLVDMETAAVAQTASLLGIPWFAIKATTDDGDGDGADSFTANLAAAARASALATEQAITLL